MEKYVNVMIANKSVSFCHYKALDEGETKWISVDDLKAAFDYAKKKKIGLNIIFPKEEVPENLQRVLDESGAGYVSTRYYDGKKLADANVVCITDVIPSVVEESSPKRPFDFAQGDNDGATVMSGDNASVMSSEVEASFHDSGAYIILVDKAGVPLIGGALKALKGKFKRLSFMLTDIETYTNEDVEKYENELEKAQDALFDIYKDVKENFPEINFVSDKWFLESLNGCNAGVDHYTLAPDGKLYVCPAFYLKGLESVGTLGNVEIINHQLLDYDHAPICKACDAYHCSRCAFLNYTMTNEWNTPSAQQCVLSHLERECSRKLLDRLQEENKLFWQIKRVSEIDYLDPLEKMLRKYRA